MLISDYSSYLNRLEETASRNAKTEILAEMIGKLEAEEVMAAMYLLNGRVVPKYQSLEFNMSEKSIVNALEKFSKNKVNVDFKDLGDAGLVAEKIIREMVEPPLDTLSLITVFDKLKSIATLEGRGSQDAKANAYNDLIKSVDPISVRYITRVIVGKLRLGLNEKTVLDAISWSIEGDKSLRDSLDRAYGVRADLGTLLKDIKALGVEALNNRSITPGIPVASKLVEREKGVAKIFERLGECIVQPKFDGLRAQVHFAKNGLEGEDILSGEQETLEINTRTNAAVFSRNMEQITEMFPDIVQAVSALEVESIVLDSEVIGYDSSEKKYIPFQETMKRKRKYGVKDKVKDIPIQVQIFDCLYINGRDISQGSLQDRLEIMKKVIPSDNEILKVSENIIIKSEKQFEDVFDRYVDEGLEGLIAKTMEGPYEPGTRNYDWIKLKATSKQGFVDSVDAVVLGFYKGKGQRTRFGIGALLLGVYDKKSDAFYSLAKLGTGVKDEEWLELKKLLDPQIINSKPDNVNVEKALYPDVWVEPATVIEVDYDQITKSKAHSAARNPSTGYGLSLRFPRMKKIRDKSSIQSTSIKELKKMYDLQV